MTGPDRVIVKFVVQKKTAMVYVKQLGKVKMLMKKVLKLVFFFKLQWNSIVFYYAEHKI